MPIKIIRRLLAGILLGAPALAAAAQPQLRIEPFLFELADGSKLPAERGRILVPEDRNDPKSREIEIGFLRLRSTSPKPGAPLVYLAGGPGGSGVQALRGARRPVFLALREVGDVIALDQRGVGWSNHVPPCTAERPLDPAKVLSEATLTDYYRQTLQQCLGRWRAAGVAVNGYTTEQNAADLEDLRRALGARKIDLWGISYGTHLAMAAMRRFPRSIGRVALASAEGMDQTASLPAEVDPVFSRMERAAQLPAGRLTGLMRRVHARFDAAPQSFALKGPDGATLSFRADSFPLRMMAGIVPKNPDGIAQLVGAYAALDQGQTGPLAPLVYNHFYRNPLTMSGMPELMDLASGASAARLRMLAAQAPASIIGSASNFPMPQLRGAVPG
ncbi:MAG TPA: alpha/beta fold hydrolase, partial [Allosphingosinicella sp.]|nr:alpha/beta fold hydrolase [Allosphingosinicella sp.]